MSPYRTASVAARPVALFVLLASAPGSGPPGPPRRRPLLTPGGHVAVGDGANYTATGTPTNSSGGYSASLTAYYGWQTILTQTNQSSSSFTLQIQRTTAVDYWLTFCKPGCSNPTWNRNMTFKAWESEVGFANLTTNGSVTENGVSVPVLALENESNHIHGNVTEAVNAAYHGILIVHTASYYFSVNASSNVSLEFTPASVSSRTRSRPRPRGTRRAGPPAPEAGPRRTITFTFRLRGRRSTWPARSGQVSGSGDVALEGVDDGSVTSKNGVSTTAVALAIARPFHIYEGFLLLPSQSTSSARARTHGPCTRTIPRRPPRRPRTSVRAGPISAPRLGDVLLSAAHQPVHPRRLLPSAGHRLRALTGGDARRRNTTGGAVVQGQPESVPSSMNHTPCLSQGTARTPAALAFRR